MGVFQAVELYILKKNEDLNFTYLWVLVVPDVTFGAIGGCLVAEGVRSPVCR